MCCSMRQVLRLAVGCFCAVDALAAGRAAARGESLAAFDERCIPTPPQRGCRVGGPGAGGVAPPSNTPGILSRRALPAGRLARLGATPDFHHGLLSGQTSRVKVTSGDAPATGRAARVAAAIVIET